MIDIQYLRTSLDEVRENLLRRHVQVDLDRLLVLDESRSRLIQELDAIRQERNQIADQVSKATPADRPAFIARGKELKDALAAREPELTAVEAEWKELLSLIPNRTHPATPTGASDEDNVEIKVCGEEQSFAFDAKSHTELAKQHDLIDFDRGAKVAGAKFYFLKGKLVLLEQALIQWVLKELVAEGFMPIETPDVAKEEVMSGTGFNPRGSEDQIYTLTGTDLSLVATAEIPVGGYFKDEILEAKDLPLRFVALSHCFRKEAGAYGKESYGLYRVHQFTKIEMFIFSTPEQSEGLHEELRRLEERIFSKLGLRYRVVDICTGDLGGPAYRKYDLEAWMWGKGEGAGGWGEVTSTSNCTDYQARRLNIRYRKEDGSVELVHTLNGTALALSRALIAVMEQYQEEDGGIRVPEVLRPFCGFDRID
jgi:seryl-tRNA synthetase